MRKSLDAAAIQLARLEGRRDTYRAQLDEAEEYLAMYTREAAELDETLAYLQTMEAEWRERFQQGLATVVSHGLSSVFGEEINVRLETTTYRDATSIDLLIEQNGLVTEVKGAKGGSLVQVLAFLLKLLMLISAQPALHPTMVLDEPFAMVSAEYRPRVGLLLRELSARLGVQFIIVSHEPELVECADVAYEVRAEGGRTMARMLHCRGEERAL